ncbi:hypothetical protein [Parafrankia sp. EUN1f]|uniref:hypothetical protein n=1 Tax=Parafrankia sp. EUN1f TaxID=102897 RepID=UPI0001C45997|nr:hypothetical protein [Parafrankia sp. EUN1f]EFC86478.1 hypothetical protein FrEUN1fDRAFT_0373 [Parafrankia sp. EUN1f]
MPYVRVSRGSEGRPEITFLAWPQVMAMGIEKLVAEAISEPGVRSVELTDDAGSRIMTREKPIAGSAVRRERAFLGRHAMPAAPDRP